MILIGQFDSPFVRRVAITLELYGMPYEHRPWSVFGDADKIAAYSPARRVPVLVLDDGEVLIESAAILDALDQLAGADRALTPATGAERRRALKICALASSVADKVVSLVYERLLHDVTSPVWIARCGDQIRGLLDALEAERVAGGSPWWSGERLSQVDITVGCVLRFLSEAQASLFDPAIWPALAAHGARCEALPVFQGIQQPFSVTPPRKA
jgi:glutathione S-transferase